TRIPGATAVQHATPRVPHSPHFRAQEDARNTCGTSNPATSEATAVVLPLPPSNTAPPTITGTAKQGQTLTEVHGTWTNSPTSYAYQWLQCNGVGSRESGRPTSRATKQTYEVAEGDVGHKLRVEETASNAGGAGKAATSEATAVVLLAVPVSTAPPTITGEARQGQTLTEHNGTWTNSPTSYSYQWLQCSALGGSCLPISEIGRAHV